MAIIPFPTRQTSHCEVLEVHAELRELGARAGDWIALRAHHPDRPVSLCRHFGPEFIRRVGAWLAAGLVGAPGSSPPDGIPREIAADPDTRHAVLQLVAAVPALGAAAGDLVYLEPGHRFPVSVQRYFAHGAAVLALLRAPAAWRMLTGGREVLEALRAASAVPGPRDVIDMATRRAGAR